MKKTLYTIIAAGVFSFVLFFIGSLFMPVRAHAALDRPIANSRPDDQECHWVNAAHIVCTFDIDIPGSIIPGRDDDTSCEDGGFDSLYDCSDYFFNALRSKEVGYPVFDSKDGTRWLFFTTKDPSKALYNDDENDWAGTYKPPIDYETNQRINKVRNSLKPGDAGDCSILNTGNCVGAGSTENLSGPGIDNAEFIATAEELKKREDLLDTCNDNAAALGFILCPILEAVNSGIASMIGGGEVVEGERQGLLISFLQLPPLLGEQSALGTVVGNVIAIANVLYVFIFLLLIFSSSLPLGLSNYNIKKMLPKFIAAVIMTQFSLLICGIVIDVFNLLGQAVPNIIFSLAYGLGNNPYSNADQVATGLGYAITGGVLAGGGGFIAFGLILILIVAIIALIAAFVAVVYMIIRYFVLYALVLLAPLAFVAWVLPGTENFFKTWWKNFIRLNAMYVTIMGMLSLALLLSTILGVSTEEQATGSASVQALIAALIPCVALLLVPKTLKWTTQGMSALAGGVMGAIAGKADSGVKSISSKGAQKAKNMANEKRQQQAAIQFGKGRARTGALLAGRLPTSKGKLLTSKESEAFIQERNKNNRASLKYAGSKLDYASYGQELTKVARGEGSKILGVNKGDSAMKVAAISEMASRGDWGDLRSNVYSSVDEQTFSMGIEPYIGDAASKAPDLVKRDRGAAFDAISADKIAQLDKSTLQEYATYVAGSPPSSPAHINLRKAALLINSDPRLAASIDPTAKSALNNTNFAGTTTPILSTKIR